MKFEARFFSRSSIRVASRRCLRTIHIAFEILERAALPSVVVAQYFRRPTTRLAFASGEGCLYGAVRFEWAYCNEAERSIEVKGLRVPRTTPLNLSLNLLRNSGDAHVSLFDTESRFFFDLDAFTQPGPSALGAQFKPVV